ncbi:MAG: hypothetical protein FD180_4258 [Planctomycetota bacterium]|nr:MAG: hypothetical protein FD180_4258 [Planctomycetota bacterium]
MTEPKPPPPPASPGAPSQKAAMEQIKARYMAGNAFSTVGEMKRLFLFILITLGGISAVLQYQWNKLKNQKEIEADNERWKKRMEAQSAGPQPGVPGGVVKWDNMLAEQKDDAPLDDVVSDKGFKYLVRHIANLKAGEGLKPEERMDYVELLQNPSAHRGNVVSLSGLLNKAFWNIRLESNQGPYDSVYRLYLVDLGGRESFIVDVLERPDGIDERSPVEADGIFIRTHKYETIKGQTARVPYFLAQRVTKIPRTASRSIWSPAVTIGVVAACVVLVAVVFLMGRAGGPKVKNTEVSSNAL